MSPKLLLLFTALGLAPASLWAFVSLVTVVVSIVYRPVSFSLRISANGRILEPLLPQMPVVPALCVLAGATIVLSGVTLFIRAK